MYFKVLVVLEVCLSVSMDVVPKSGMNEALQGMPHAIRVWLSGRSPGAPRHEHLTKYPSQMDFLRYESPKFCEWTGSIHFAPHFGDCEIFSTDYLSGWNARGGVAVVLRIAEVYRTCSR